MQYLTEEQQYNVEDGSKVLALYIGWIEITGTVAGSRAVYGVSKVYDVILDADLLIPWCTGTRYKAGDCVGIEHKNIVGII
jgi:hypothetical protein